MEELTLERVRRQIDEVLELQDRYAARILAPKLFARMQLCAERGVEPKGVAKRLSVRVPARPIAEALDGLALQFEFPSAYPDSAALQLRVVPVCGGDGDGGEGGTSIAGADGSGGAGAGTCAGAGAAGAVEALAAKTEASVAEYLVPFIGHECVFAALEFLSDQACELAAAAAAALEPRGQICFALRFNHLLKGPEHKKEKSMVDTAKKQGLQGAIVWGTPGVIILTGCTEADAAEYLSACRAIGKRGEMLMPLHLAAEALESQGLGGLAQQKRGGKLAELNTAGLRASLGGDETLLKTVLGVQ